MQLLPSSSQNGITQSLLSFVDRYSLRRGLSCFLLNGDEQIRPGTEGQGFLQAEAWNSVLTMAATIEPLLISKSSSKVRESNEEDSDSDEDESNTSLLEKSILPSSSGYWSPLMARLLLHIYCRQASEKQLSNTLSKAVELWSAPTRIKTALWQQEVYLTTVILLLVAQLPTASTSALCTSAAFISGVSVHLEHLSPQVRRMGMLVAEIVSTASGGKALSFGRSIWDGKGEGKEEARVLRAMYHGWGSREKVTVKVDEQAKLSAFGLSNTLEVATRQASVSVREERKAPKTRSLPAKTAAPSRMKPLIQSLDGDDSLQDNTLQDESLPSLTNLQSIRGTSSSIQPLPYSSDGEISSSSESNSSDSDIEGGNIPQIPVEKKEEFGLGMPQKKKRRAPIYIHELAPLFREQEREANKLALKHAEPLIKKKTGWGGEIDENAINLALAIISLQNNFSFKLFEEKKKEILTALVVASPRLVAPCLAEAYFNQQYSMTQRVCILNSLAFGARQISITGKQGDETNLKTLAEGFSHMAIVRSRVEGERRLPQGRPEDKSVLLQQSAPKSLDAGNGVSRSKVTKKGNVYLELAGPSFIFPLVNRFWSHLDHANMTRSSRYRGSGSTILFDPFLIGAFLDTLAILCYCAQNAINFSSDIVPEVISLTLTMTNSALARISQGEDSQGGGPLSILGAAANLFLLLMDAVCEVDDGRTLMHRHRNLIQQVETWAQAVFESAEASGNIDRAGRCSAALLVRVNEMKLARQ
jgi:telomere length regulation protein